MADDQDLAGRVVVVTGANTGLGKATALQLARRGGEVVLACRTEAKALPVVAEIVAATGNEAVSFHALDLADLAAVLRSAEALLATDRPLHVLVNNAGLAGQRGRTADGFELAFGTNHVGHFLFTTLLLDRITASAEPGRPARVVNVASGNHFHAKGIDWEAVRRPTRTFVGLHEYDVSKLANVCFTQELARRLDPAQVVAFATNPGPVATDVWRRMPGPLYTVFKKVRGLKTPAEGALPTVRAATDPTLDDRSGAYVDEDGSVIPASEVATPELGAELWSRSEAWVEPAAR